MGASLSNPSTCTGSETSCFRQPRSSSKEPEAAKCRKRSSSRWHSGHRSQLERSLMLVRSTLGEVLSTAKGLDHASVEKLRECERLVRIAEASNGEQDVLEIGEHTAGDSSTAALPSEVRDWLSTLWREENGASAQEPLSPGSHGRIDDSPAPGPQSAPVSPELRSLLDKVGGFEVDVIAVSKQPEVAGNVVTVLFMYALQNSGLLGRLPQSCFLPVPVGNSLEDRLLNFMHKIDEAYLDTPYHNNRHAADVCMMMHWFFQSSHLRTHLNPLNHLMGLIAGAIHDVGHDGVNNMFHIKTQSQVALRYNDRSVLESMHLALAFELMREQEETDWFSLLSTQYQADQCQKASDLKQYFRKGLVEMVLSTDTTRHDALMVDLKGLVQANAENSSDSSSREIFGNPQQKQNMMNVLLHAADVSNPARPQPIALEWSRRVLMEFWAQGDEERRLGLEVSPLCDRAGGMAAVPQGQLGFISFIVRPLLTQVEQIISEVSLATTQLEDNVKYWEKKKEEKASFQECFAVLGAP
mmetsp:Transcript_63894/g.103418  ORF Transcript_63894/g.103418 Transcript_63894/m.103418 type:complete len:526 (-) Transcript_63894:149-1726(-)